jgi:HAD superfamily hydrolase (TIGR01509 family)
VSLLGRPGTPKDSRDLTRRNIDIYTPHLGIDYLGARDWTLSVGVIGSRVLYWMRILLKTFPNGDFRVTRDAGQNSPAAVLFDMDGTLVDSEKLWTIALADYAAHRGGVLTDATREGMVGSNMTRSMRMLLADVGVPDTDAEVEAAAKWVAARMAVLFEQGLPWRPGAPEALREARSLGIPTALVTSTIRSLTELALETLGRDSFDVTVCGDEVDGQNKPHPEPYLKAARLLGVDAADCVAIEDSPTGVAAAEAAGCVVIAIPCEVPLQPGPHRLLCDSLEDVNFAALGELFTRAA